jgi:hypothetical protein
MTEDDMNSVEVFETCSWDVRLVQSKMCDERTDGVIQT